MKIKIMHVLGLIIGASLLLVSIILRSQEVSFFLGGLGILIALFPFIFSIMREGKIYAEKEEMFLEFTRNLVEEVKTGTPISKAILNVRDKNYGALSENIRKLANQISIGIPLREALKNFSRDVRDKKISQAITLIGSAEESGGDIGGILESVATAVSMSDKLKKERKAAIQTIVVQGYIIFLVFIIIILVMQFKIIPIVAGIASSSGENIEGEELINVNSTQQEFDITNVSRSFLYLLITQGFFSGLAIGKLATGKIRDGIKHSFVLVILSFLIAEGANVLAS